MTTTTVALVALAVLVAVSAATGALIGATAAHRHCRSHAHLIGEVDRLRGRIAVHDTTHPECHDIERPRRAR